MILASLKGPINPNIYMPQASPILKDLAFVKSTFVKSTEFIAGEYWVEQPTARKANPITAINNLFIFTSIYSYEKKISIRSNHIIICSNIQSLFCLFTQVRWELSRYIFN
jgi:hypothetical protein